ncbi:hypothetical protein [Methanolapillus millepedarum]|uniref:Uncharacterized protein n=1 Tax=Methanolapillus millepedarum TaxID=3028296 RepID=A0AA96V157_9EURY|nr:hypothetical protein MsAc7_00410 [Methanosarcinaceae archaeon Ac7]
MDFDFKLMKESAQKSWHVFVGHIVVYVVAAIILIIVTGLASLFVAGVALVGAVSSFNLSFEVSTAFGAVLILIGLVGVVFLPPVSYGVYYMCLKGLRGEKVEVKDIMYGFKSTNTFFRGWIYFIIFYALFIVLSVISLFLGFIPFLGGLISFIIHLIIHTVLFFSFYIYVMTPKENVIYALQESVKIAKNHFIMTFVTMILAGLFCILIVTIPFGIAFGAEMLKKIVPTIRDGS